MRKRKSLMLPNKKSKVLTDMGGYSTLIYGEKKIGKTTMLQHFEDALFFMFERGAKKLSIYKRNPKDWKQFKAYVDLVIEDDFFKTIVVDPVDISYDMCLAYACNKLGIVHPADAKWGKGWRAVKDEYQGVMRKLTTCGKGVVFVSHQKYVKIEGRNGKEFDYKTNTMPGQANELIVGDVDIWANYDYVNSRRVLTIIGDDLIDAGHRLNEDPEPRFLYTNGKPIRRIDMGNHSSEAFENFLNAFNNKLKQPKLTKKKKRGK